MPNKILIVGLSMLNSGEFVAALRSLHPDFEIVVVQDLDMEAVKQLAREGLQKEGLADLYSVRDTCLDEIVDLAVDLDPYK